MRRIGRHLKIWFGLVWFGFMSTIVGYLMPSTVFTYSLNTWIINTSCRYTELNVKTVLFQTIQFSQQLNGSKYCYAQLKIELNISSQNQMVKQFFIKRFNLGYHLFSLFKRLAVLFDPYRGTYKELPLRSRAGMGAMAMKRYSAFPKALALREPHHQMV